MRKSPSALLLRSLLSVGAILAFASVAQATPRHVRLSWTTSDTTGTMTVAWNTSTETASQVRFGLDETYGLVAEGTCFEAQGGLGWVHEVTLTGLEPDAVYHYRAGSPMGWSDDLTFRTAPAPDGCTPFSFIALGDNRSDDERGSSPKWGSILGESLVDDPAFVLNTGDLVKSGTEWEQWEVFLGDTSPGSRYVPFFASMGNHDDDSIEGDGALYNNVFALPRNDVSGTEDYYYFTYGDAIFVSLSTVTFEGGATPYGEQAAWLDRVLTENPKTWKFVFFHHPPYTGYLDLFGLDVNHPPNENGQNPAFGPIIDKHHVDIVFNGHNHFYQRFQPMQYSSANPEEGIPVSDPADGTIYSITGGAGALTYAIDLYMWGLCAFTTGAEACGGHHHFVTIEIDGGTLRYTATTTAQQILGSDEANVGIIDSFEIVKPGYTAVCAPPPVDEGPAPDVASPVDVHTVDAGPTEVVTPAPDVPVAAPDLPVAPPDVPEPAEDVPPAPDAGDQPFEDTGNAPAGADTPMAPGADSGAARPDAAGTTASAGGGGGCAATPTTAAPGSTAALLLLFLYGVALLRRRGVPARR